MSIYFSEEGKKKVYECYDSFMEQLGEPFEDIYTDTRYGKLHMVKVGNPNGKPLLIYPGFSVTAPFQLIICKHFLKDYCCYGIDAIGHPGKSEDRFMPNEKHAYGNCVNDALNNLGINEVYAFASSLQCGMLTDLMAVAPEKVKKAILYVPAVVKGNVFIQVEWYFLHMVSKWKKDSDKKLLHKLNVLMSQDDAYRNDIEGIASLVTFNNMNEGSLYKMPKNKEVYKCKADTLLLMGELDKFYPMKSIRKGTKTMLYSPDYYVMKNHGHTGHMSEECKQYTLDFLAK